MAQRADEHALIVLHLDDRELQTVGQVLNGSGVGLDLAGGTPGEQPRRRRRDRRAAGGLRSQRHAGRRQTGDDLQ
jgi:hypothetical protein